MNPIAVIKNIPMTISRMGGRTGLLAKKHSPEILVGVGIVGGVTAAVMACKATKKIDDVTYEHKNAIMLANQVEASTDKNDVVEMKAKAYLGLASDYMKLYGPPIALGVASIGCIVGGHGILKKRNIAIAAAYSVVQDRLNEYRQRVVNEFGEDKDFELYHGVKKQEITVEEVDENGKKKKVKKTVNVADPNGYSKYARFFDDASPNWVSEPEYNLLFLKAQQNYANDLLHARGHIFLNEVYDQLGIPRSKEGSVVGWVLGDGDNFVDFGIYDTRNQEAMDFVNGYENSILLDFNVDGLIYDLI